MIHRVKFLVGSVWLMGMKQDMILFVFQMLLLIMVISSIFTLMHDVHDTSLVEVLSSQTLCPI